MLTFDDATHTYTLDGTVLPSVTQVIHASGLIDFGQIPAAVLEHARERGRRVHQAIHYYNEGDLDPASLDDEVRPRLQAWQAFLAQRNFQILAAEKRVYSRRHRYAGTLDVIGTLDGKFTLVDFKCGSPEEVAADLQTGAYVGAVCEMSGLGSEAWIDAIDVTKPIRRFAIQLKRDGTFKLDPYVNPTDFRQFTTLMDARRIVEARRGYFRAWLDENGVAA
jgi:hypothetical protein